MIGQQGFAQSENGFDSFKKDILSQFGTYFENVEISGDGNINLYATAAYNSLLPVKKNTIIETILSKSTNNFVIVQYQYKRELWKKEPKNNMVNLIDIWDMNSIMRTSNVKAPQKTNSHPWFFYLGAGGGGILSSGSNSETQGDNLNLTSRLGFFLLKNRWDLALSYSCLFTDYSDASTYTMTIGLMTKVYFPIRKFNISPYIGVGVSDISTASSDSYDTPVYLGISWFVGHGSLDLGFQYGNNNNSMVTIGYTFSLWSK